MSKVIVFIASSVDGFIAGENDELDWLHGRGGVEDTFGPFIETVGCMVMGRRTYDVVSGMDVAWPYGEIPVLVPTHRPLESAPPTVREVSGDLQPILETARAEAGAKNVYLDGGALVRDAMDAGLVDEIRITVIPTVRGAGRPLFAGVAAPREFELLGHRALGGGLVELRYRVHS